MKVNGSLVTGYTQDSLNTWDTTDPRKFRFFPLENPDGSVVPHSYLMTSTEWYNPSGYDFTNLVAIVSNVTAAPTGTSNSASVALTPAPSQSATAGVPQSWSLGSFTASNTAAPYTVSVNWGDGTPDTIFTTNTPGTLPPQSHTYTAAGSDTASVTVTDAAGHASNTATFTATVAGGLTPAVVRSTLPTSLVSGAKAKGTVLVSLTNHSAGPVHGAQTLALYASPSGSLDASSVLIAQVKHAVNLKPGQTARIALPVRALALPAGTYTLLPALTDTGSSAGAIAASTGPTLSIVPAYVSLSGAITAATPATLTAGQPITLTLALANAGNVAATGKGSFAVALSTDGVNASIPLQTFTRTVALKPGGKTLTLHLKVKLPLTATAGTYFPLVAFTQGTNTLSLASVQPVTVR